MTIAHALVSKAQDVIFRFKLCQAAIFLRTDYNDASMQEFTALDADDLFENGWEI